MSSNVMLSNGNGSVFYSAMDDGAHLEISPALRIPVGELHYRASRSGGPGGQHVNTSSTRVELVWDLKASPSLSAAVRAQLHARLAHRLDSKGRLRLVSSTTRSQTRNREEVTERLRDLLAAALVVPTPRKPTKPSRAARAARLAAKRRQAARKRERRAPRDDNE